MRFRLRYWYSTSRRQWLFEGIMPTFWTSNIGHFIWIHSAMPARKCCRSQQQFVKKGCCLLSDYSNCYQSGDSEARSNEYQWSCKEAFLSLTLTKVQNLFLSLLSREELLVCSLNDCFYWQQILVASLLIVSFSEYCLRSKQKVVWVPSTLRTSESISFEKNERVVERLGWLRKIFKPQRYCLSY